MEGVSIAASLIGIGAAGSQIALKLYTLATQISTASERISSISNDVSLTSAVIHQLGELMTTKANHDGTTIFSQGGLDTTRTSAAMCETIFKHIERAAREASEQIRGRVRFTGGNVKLSRSEKLKWPFLQPSMDTLRDDLREAKGTLMLMLQVNLLAFSKKTAEVNQTTSKNVVEQREIIDAILAIQQQQQRSQNLKLQRLSPSPSSDDKLKAVISNNIDKTASKLDAEPTFAPNPFSNPTKTLPTRPNVLIALPSPISAITEKTPKGSMSNCASKSVATDCHAGDQHLNREDAIASSSGQSSLRCNSIPTPAESSVCDEVQSVKTLRFCLMKPVIQDLGDVIQLSWKIHSVLMQQAEIRNQISKNEEEGLPLVNEVFQNLYAHEHAALEDTISKDGASFDVSLRSLKRIYIDLTHREILFKGIPGLEFVLERTIQQPFPQSLSFTRAQAAASASLQPRSSAHVKKLRLGDFGDNTSFGSWADERNDAPAPAPARSPVKEDRFEVNDHMDEKRSKGGAAARRFRERREAKQAQQEALIAELDMWKKRAAEKSWRPKESAAQGARRPMTSDTVEPSETPGKMSVSPSDFGTCAVSSVRAVAESSITPEQIISREGHEDKSKTKDTQAKREEEKSSKQVSSTLSTNARKRTKTGCLMWRRAPNVQQLCEIETDL
ncbi:MAG: hypothetical protein Q9226_001152 [Calogaya cf. arnoldii]